MDGVLRLGSEAQVPPHSHLAVVVVPDDPTSAELAAWTEAANALGFLHEEPELYTDADIIPWRRNPRFGGRS